MKRIKFLIGVLAILCVAAATFYALNSDNALVINPKEISAHGQLHLIRKNILLMLIIAIPTIALLFVIAWKYRTKKSKATYDLMVGWILWIIPVCIIVVLVVVAYKAIHN